MRSTLDVSECFDSILVRLKVAGGVEFEMYLKFRFHTGSIKSYEC